MKKISELMDELGFDPEGSTAVKEAFIKYLIKNTHQVNVLTPTEKTLIQTNPQVRFLEKPAEPPQTTNQLQFDFMSDLQPKSVKRRKIS